jgi:LmbE family N-acetylglucosaminyl deacetylase
MAFLIKQQTEKLQEKSQQPQPEQPAARPAAAPARPKGGQGWVFTNCLIIVAHPNDEILWAGGLMLLHHETRWTVITLTRQSDPDRSAKFNNVMKHLGAKGIMGDLVDGPEQKPFAEKDIRKTLLSLLPMDKFDMVLTHSRWGEYTKQLRHGETSKAVLAMYNTKELHAKQMWMFAYEDGGGKYLPRPSRDADVSVWLPENIAQEKYKIITELYGNAADSFEAKACPKKEAFWTLGAK